MAEKLLGAVLVVIMWLTTYAISAYVNSNLAHGEVYLIKYYEIKSVRHLIKYVRHLIKSVRHLIKSVRHLIKS